MHVPGSIHRFNAFDAQVYGVSVDLPPAQNVFIMQEGLTFPMLSDWDHEVIHNDGVVVPEMYGQFGVAKRSIFVLDEEGTITYPRVEHEGAIDFGAVIDTVAEASAA